MPEEVVYSSPGNWVQVFETPNRFYYLRRKNRDSIALFLIRKNDSNKWEVLIRWQPLPLHNSEAREPASLFACPITGGFESMGEQPSVCARREALEEAGYRLDNQIRHLGKYIVGTQTDESVYMMFADVTGIEPEEATQDGSYLESISRNQWMPIQYLNQEGGYSANQIGYLRLSQIFGRYEMD